MRIIKGTETGLVDSHGYNENETYAQVWYPWQNTSMTYNKVMRNNFEWDDNKRIINLEKHGLDFIDAIDVFYDDERIETQIEKSGEQRYITIGMVNEVILLVVYTKRGRKKRIISARIASKKERLEYVKARYKDEE